jgi:hypothetical protein
MVYNHTHGIPASTAGWFPLKGNYTTKSEVHLSMHFDGRTSGHARE